jgi:lipopolysaccharide transport system permease protein
MNVAWLVLGAELSHGRSVHVEAALRNQSGEAWCSAEGFAVSYQLFDAETATVIADGPRLHPERDIQPGEALPVIVDVELPPEDGRYRVYLSPLREGLHWHYDLGWPFLLLDATVANGVARLDRVREATRATVRREDALRAIGRAFIYPVLTIWRNWSLIRVMVRRDILGRYRGSFGGALWTIMNPLLLMLTYFYVFGVILKSRFPGDPSRSGFALYFLAGMLPWLAFSEAVGRSPSVMLEHRNFVKKLVFAVETLPVNLVASGLVSGLFAAVLFCVVLLVVRHSIPVSVLWLPVLLVPQILFTAGLSWFLAALGVFVRDLGQILGFVLTIWFFATPICYPEEAMPAALVPLFSKNPIYVLVRGYRAIFLQNQAPPLGPLWKFWLLSAAVFVLGHAWFYKLRKSFADLI